MQSEYTTKEWQLINDEFKRVKDTVYLDHAGATLYSEPQLADIYALLGSTVLTNPHTSKHTEDLCDQVRYRVLASLNASPDEYSVIFMSGATAALKTVAECFAFASDDESTPSENGCFAYLTDNHTSVLGMRAVVNTPHIVPVSPAEFNEFSVVVETNGTAASVDSVVDDEPLRPNSLFVYPGQCNFSGRKYPLDVIPHLQRKGITTSSSTPSQRTTSNWYVLLDAASLVATGTLDLSAHPADFVCMSFYKVFGYPTGLGALLVSRRGERVLRKRYYGGGTVQIALAAQNWHVKRDRAMHERFEDGTLSFLSIVGLLSGYKTRERLVPATATADTQTRIERHCFAVAQYLHRQLRALRYADGQPLVRFYHDTDWEDVRQQGGIVNFNVLNECGSVVGFREVAEIAEVYGVTLRTGCFCNPGACQRHLRLSDEEVRQHFQAGHVCGDLVDLIDGTPTGSVRISIGYMTTVENVDRVVRMLRDTYIGSQIAQPLINPLETTPKSPAQHPTNKRPIRLKHICVYPIKSCAPHRITVGRWPLNDRGLCYDREWMVVSATTGAALTQKSNTRLCLVQPHVDTAAGLLQLTFPLHTESVSVSLTAAPDTDEVDFSSPSLCQSKVCGDRVEGHDCGDRVANWLADVLCDPDVRLIRQNVGVARLSRPFDKSPEAKPHAARSMSLANKAQFLLINAASVQWLIEQVDAWAYAADGVGASMDAKLHRLLLQNTVDRFRGNLIVDVPGGDGALRELQWQRLRVGGGTLTAPGGVRFRVQGPCTRCQMVCIDQASGEKTAEPLRTISRVFAGKMRFGVYLEYETFGGRARSDEEVGYLECGDRVYVE